jgi:hypothetical protein
VTPRSASRNATGLEVIEEPRSAWMASCPGLICCLAQVWPIIVSARAADSRGATIQPVTCRLPPLGGLRQQFAEHDPGLLLGLNCLPVAQVPAGQRIDARVHMDTEGTAR